MRSLAMIVAAGVATSLCAGPGGLIGAEPERALRPAVGADCAWSSSFHLPDLDYDVYTMTTYDDGDGPALYAGGWFATAGAVQASSVARWDGHQWTPLEGSFGEGIGARVNALAVYDDGTGPALYAGGLFSTAGGLPASNIARWVGGEWSALTVSRRNGVDGEVFALAVFDDGDGPALYAGGRFTRAGGVVVGNIARWNGAGWAALSGPSGNGMDDEVRSLVGVSGGPGAGLYAGGSFSTAGGIPANSIARWDGKGWAPLEGPSGNGVSGGSSGPYVLDMVVSEVGGGFVLYAGGWFTSAGGVDANRIARWDGSSWSALQGPSGNGIGGWVDALAVVTSGEAEGLYAGGDFLSAGGVVSYRVARWDGSSWSPVSSGCDARVRTLEAVDLGGGPSLYAGGEFTRAGAVGASFIASWNGTAWSVVAGPAGNGVNDTVMAMAEHDDGSGRALYVGGDFTAAGGIVARYIARWDGDGWSDVSGPGGNRLKNNVWALSEYDEGRGPMLFAGGLFNRWSSPQMCNIARWDGSEWSALGGAPDYGTDGYVYTLVAHDDGSGPALYAGGIFSSAGGVTVNQVARWDGSQWSALAGPLGTGVSGVVDDLEVFDDGNGPALYAAGYFDSAGGVVVNGIAKWDGTVWSRLVGSSGFGLDGSAEALAVFDDGSGPALFVGGWFAVAGGVPANFIARWDGKEWSALQGPVGNGVNAPVNAMAVHDDGRGPALYVGGVFDNAGGLPVHFLARWDGTTWSPVEGATVDGVNSTIRYLGSFNDGHRPALYGGGWFSQAGGLVSNRFFRRQCAGIFADGFESGTTSEWSGTVPRNHAD